MCGAEVILMPRWGHGSFSSDVRSKIQVSSVAMAEAVHSEIGKAVAVYLQYIHVSGPLSCS